MKELMTKNLHMSRELKHCHILPIKIQEIINQYCHRTLKNVKTMNQSNQEMTNIRQEISNHHIQANQQKAQLIKTIVSNQQREQVTNLILKTNQHLLKLQAQLQSSINNLISLDRKTSSSSKNKENTFRQSIL